MKDVISMNLVRFPEQTSLEINEFAKIIYKLINSANSRILRPQIDKLIQTPFALWHSLIDELIAKAPMQPITDDSLAFWLKEISEKYGQLDGGLRKKFLTETNQSVLSIYEKSGKTPSNL
jgi:hypothetical protein